MMEIQAALKQLQYACFKDSVEGLSAKPPTITCLLCGAAMRRNLDTLQKHVVSQAHKAAIRKIEKQAVEDSVAGLGMCSSDAILRPICILPFKPDHMTKHLLHLIIQVVQIGRRSGSMSHRLRWLAIGRNSCALEQWYPYCSMAAQ
jgi:hypothetical protein